jgi:hypothetical protein
MSVEDDEATGEALRRYAAQGSDLSRPMEIDFFVAVPDREAGERVAQRSRELGLMTSVEQDQATGDWTCYCKKTLVPSYEAVRAIERLLDEIARQFGGHADGFGSFGNAIGAS